MRCEIKCGKKCYIKYTDGSEEWLEDDELHRTDGPAYINPSGLQYWYFHGIRINSLEQLQTVAGLSDEEMTFLALKYGDIKCYLY